MTLNATHTARELGFRNMEEVASIYHCSAQWLHSIYHKDLEKFEAVLIACRILKDRSRDPMTKRLKRAREEAKLSRYALHSLITTANELANRA